MTDKVQNEVDISAVLDTFVYLDDQQRSYKGMTLKQIIEHMGNYAEAMTEEQRSYYTTIKDALDRDTSGQLAKMKLVSQSSLNTDISKEHLFACTFASEAEDGNHYYVAYRGTGDGKWVDNGEGMYKDKTVMQKAAADYFDYVVETKGLKESDHIIVTGHSKGGNSAQFVTLASRHYDLIDSCYSFDGQGFSRKAIEELFLPHLGGEEAYQAQLNKMYSINGENDPVHELGIVVIPGERTYYVKVDENAGIAGLHALQDMIIDGRVHIDPELGPGPVSEFAKTLSAEMMKLSEEDLQDCALSIMSLIERYAFGGEVYLEGTGDVKFATAEEFCGFIAVGIPLILKTALTTEEGRATVGILAMEAVKGIASSENGGWMLVGIAALALLCAPAVVKLGRSALSAFSFADAVFDLFDGTFELSDISGTIIIARTVAKAAAFLAGHPYVVIAVLTVAAVVALVTFIVQHWDDIKAFAEAVGNFIIGAAAAIYAWAENLAAQATALIKSAIGKAAELYQNVKQAILDFGSRLLSAAADFFSGIAQAAVGFLGSIASWVQSVFGNGSSALAYGSRITAAMSYIDDLQYRMESLRGDYLAVGASARDADGVVSRVYGYYNESYVRSCCRDIQNELKNAQRYVNSVEQKLARRRRALRSASEDYRRSDQNAARDIRKFSLSFC